MAADDGIASVHHVFPYDPGHIGLTVDRWWAIQSATWPIAAAFAGRWPDRTTVHVLDGFGSPPVADPRLRVSRARRAGPDRVRWGGDRSAELERHLRRLGPGDVCFVHGDSHPAADLAAASASRAHVIAVAHNDGVGPPGLLARIASHQIVLRSDLRDRLAVAGHPAELVLAEPSVAPEFFAVRRPPDIAPPRRGTGRPLRLGHIGRLTWNKGVDAIAPTLGALRDIGLVGVLEVVGTVDPMSFATLAESVAPTGWTVERSHQLTTAELAEHVARWDAVLLPSRSEGFPRVVVEALAAGTPVAAVAAVLPPELERRPGVHVAERDRLVQAVAAIVLAPRAQHRVLAAGASAHGDAARVLDELAEQATRRAPVGTRPTLAIAPRLRRRALDLRVRRALSPLQPRHRYQRAVRSVTGRPTARAAPDGVVPSSEG